MILIFVNYGSHNDKGDVGRVQRVTIIRKRFRVKHLTSLQTSIERESHAAIGLCSDLEKRPRERHRVTFTFLNSNILTEFLRILKTFDLRPIYSFKIQLHYPFTISILFYRRF